MPETKRTLLFSTYSDSWAITPWQADNSTPTYPSGYTQGGDPARINSGRYGKFSGTGNSVLLDNTVLTGNIIASEAQLTTIGSDSMGLCICSPVGTGYQILINSTNIRVFAMTAFVLGAQVGASIAFVPTSNHFARFERNNITGTMTIYTGVDMSSLVSRGSVTQANGNTDWRAGIFARNSGNIASLISAFTPAQTIVSINSGNPIIANQTTVASVTTGFTGLPTSITCDLAGITCSSISGTTNAPTFVKSQRVNGQPWPLNGATATFTYVNGLESASGTQVIQKEAGDVVLTVSGGITDDPSTWTYWLTQDGFTVEGGEHSYTPYGDLVLTADGGGTVTDAGTFTSWFRPSTGTGAGNVYYYTWTLTDSGSVVITTSSKNVVLGIGYGIGI